MNPAHLAARRCVPPLEWGALTWPAIVLAICALIVPPLVSHLWYQPLPVRPVTAPSRDSPTARSSPPHPETPTTSAPLQQGTASHAPGSSSERGPDAK
jgi:hypothetical protein